MRYGYNDERYVRPAPKWTVTRIIYLLIAIVFLINIWLFLNEKLLFGSDWISATYDNEDWRTNEGNLPTYGAWDIEAHIWKTEYLVEHWPNVQWNPHWYLGMPLFKYYQPGFYLANIGMMFLLGVSAARGALLLVIFGHLLATLLTFILCYKFSRNLMVSALIAVFVLANTFISLRSYGWEPITVVFLWLFPLGLLLFFRNPTRPFRLSLLIVMVVAYYSHPLLFFALSMTMGMYLLSLALRKDLDDDVSRTHFIWQYLGLVGTSILLGAPQFLMQVSYSQVTSGAHMGVSYLPFYQVVFNIIPPHQLLFDAGNLKGPGFVILIAALLLVTFSILGVMRRRKQPRKSVRPGRILEGHVIVAGLGVVLLTMVLFYYMEGLNIFPMNVLRGIQYHRIIPEFVIVASALIASIYWLADTRKRRVFYMSSLIAFVLASGLILWQVQLRWETTPSIADNQEFIRDEFEGRMSHPYTEQSLAVRNSFTNTPQVYGYYEQGITNSYTDELLSVSSGYHNAELTILYLQAANVARLYTNDEAGVRGEITRSRLEGVVPYTPGNGTRYGYFSIPLVDASLAQTVSSETALSVLELEPGCRVLYSVEYCGSVKEEFVTKDPAEVKYLQAYVALISNPGPGTAEITALNPDTYRIRVMNATIDTAVVVKMTHDEDFAATVNGRDLPIRTIGPDFMLLAPGMKGDYVITLRYHTPRLLFVGLIIAGITALGVAILLIIRSRISRPSIARFPDGDMT